MVPRLGVNIKQNNQEENSVGVIFMGIKKSVGVIFMMPTLFLIP